MAYAEVDPEIRMLVSWLIVVLFAVAGIACGSPRDRNASPRQRPRRSRKAMAAK